MRLSGVGEAVTIAPGHRNSVSFDVDRTLRGVLFFLVRPVSKWMMGHAWITDQGPRTADRESRLMASRGGGQLDDSRELLGLVILVATGIKDQGAWTLQHQALGTKVGRFVPGHDRQRDNESVGIMACADAPRRDADGPKKADEGGKPSSAGS